MHIRTIQAGDGRLLMDLTLQSVTEDTYAFGGAGTLAEERLRPEAEWHQLAAECAGEVAAWRDRCVGYFIMDGDAAIAKALSYLCHRTAHRAYLSGVWVNSGYRRRGLGRLLVEESCGWAASKGADQMRLWVDDMNPWGVAFYQSLGFRATGEKRPVNAGASEMEQEFEILLPLGKQRVGASAGFAG